MTPQLAEIVESLELMADREGGRTDCVKLPDYVAAITWMQDLGYAGVEAYDNSKFYYMLLPQHGRYDLAAKVAAEVATTGRDPLQAEALIIRQEFEAERLHAERRARLEAAMEAASTPPVPGYAYAGSSEASQRRRGCYCAPSYANICHLSGLCLLCSLTPIYRDMYARPREQKGRIMVIR